MILRNHLLTLIALACLASFFTSAQAQDNVTITLAASPKARYMPDTTAVKNADGGFTYNFKGTIFNPPVELFSPAPIQDQSSPLPVIQKGVEAAIRYDWDSYQKLFDPESLPALQNDMTDPQFQEFIGKEYGSAKSIKANFAISVEDVLLVFCTFSGEGVTVPYAPFALKKIGDKWMLERPSLKDGSLVTNISEGMVMKTITVK